MGALLPNEQLATQRHRRSRGSSRGSRRDNQARKRVVRDRSGFAPFAARIPARQAPTDDRRDHRRRTGGLRAGRVAESARVARIYSLAVHARFARRGVGRALLQACEAYARRDGRSALTLEVRYDNASAIALYETSGFRQFGEHRHYYADGATALRYEKSFLPVPRRETGTIRRRRALDRCAGHRAGARWGGRARRDSRRSFSSPSRLTSGNTPPVIMKKLSRLSVRPRDARDERLGHSRRSGARLPQRRHASQGYHHARLSRAAETVRRVGSGKDHQSFALLQLPVQGLLRLSARRSARSSRDPDRRDNARFA